jgi:hypothetical protein
MVPLDRAIVNSYAMNDTGQEFSVRVAQKTGEFGTWLATWDVHAYLAGTYFERW